MTGLRNRWYTPASMLLVGCVICMADTDDCPVGTPYRTWFFAPPQGTVVGFPRPGFSAEEDAHIRARGYRRMAVKGFLRCFTDGTPSSCEDSVFFYYDSSAAPGRGGIVDSFFMGRESACLFSPRPAERRNRSACGAASIRETVDSGGMFLVGRGEASLHLYDQPFSWLLAEERAIKALCRQSLLSFASLTRACIGRENDVRSVVRIAMDLEVRNLAVVSRSYNATRNLCVVRVGCRACDIGPWRQRHHSTERMELYRKGFPAGAR